MKMRAGTSTRITHPPEYRTAIDVLPVPDAERFEMRIQRLKSVGVAYDNKPAVIPDLAFYMDNSTSRSGADRCTDPVGEIDPVVKPWQSGKRVGPHAVPAGKLTPCR